nr:ribonuclease H-like domain-containing protein [Tanacetum cinerariifolium]
CCQLFAASAARINAVKPSAITVVQHNRTKKAHDRTDFEELNGGYVTFGGNPKGGKITGKGKIKTGKLDFDDVYYVCNAPLHKEDRYILIIAFHQSIFKKA